MTSHDASVCPRDGEERRDVSPPVPGEGQTAEPPSTADLLRAEIARRERAEEQLRRVSRAHLALRHCNQALIKVREERALLEEICRIVVEVAGYRLCWVGYAEKDEARTVRPVGQAGYEAGYLQTVRVTWA